MFPYVFVRSHWQQFHQFHILEWKNSKSYAAFKKINLKFIKLSENAIYLVVTVLVELSQS